MALYFVVLSILHPLHLHLGYDLDIVHEVQNLTVFLLFFPKDLKMDSKYFDDK